MRLFGREIAASGKADGFIAAAIAILIFIILGFVSGVLPSVKQHIEGPGARCPTFDHMPQCLPNKSHPNPDPL